MTATSLHLVDAHGSRYEARGTQVTVTFTDTDVATATVTGKPWVSADTVFTLVPCGTSSRSGFDSLLDEVKFAVDNVVPGVGFDVVAYAPRPGGSSGSFTVHVVGV